MISKNKSIMNKTLVSFTLGLLAGAAAGVALAAWLTDQNVGEVQKKFAEKADSLRDELADHIEALKEKLEKNSKH
jgi:Na+/glutamate symporter